MSPERFRGEGDERSDLYALGATLYEMLVLQPAFAASDEVNLMSAIQDSEPPRLRSVDGDISRDLETIVHKSMEKDPDRRYASTQSLAGVLMFGLLSVEIVSFVAMVAFQNLAQEAQTEADTAAAINEFFNRDVLGAGNPVNGNVDRNTTLLQVLDASSKKIGLCFECNPVVKSRIHLTIGEAYLALSEFERAERHLTQAQQLMAENLPADHADRQGVELQLGRLYRDSVKDFRCGYRILNVIQKKRVDELGVDHPLALEASCEHVFSRLAMTQGGGIAVCQFVSNQAGRLP